MPQISAHSNLNTENDYYNLPENVRAELIDGQFYNMSVPSRIHQEILSLLHVEISNYIRSRKGSCRVYPAPFAVRLFENDKTVVEPDISVICDPGKLTDRGCNGAPDWIIEITSPSSFVHDYVRKLNLYMDAGVREYWIVDPMKHSIYVYVLVHHFTNPWSLSTCYLRHCRVGFNRRCHRIASFSRLALTQISGT